MSLLYINPGYPTLFVNQGFEYFSGTDSKYTKSNIYFVPYEYNNYQVIYKNEGASIYKTLYFKFSIYASMVNTSFQEDGFFKVSTKTHNVILTMDKSFHLVLKVDDLILHTMPFKQRKLNDIELRVTSTQDKEIITLWVNEKQKFTNEDKIIQLLDGETIVSCACKNILAVISDDMRRHGMAFSNFLIADSHLDILDCLVLDTDIEDNWKNTDIEKRDNERIITQTVKPENLIDIANNEYSVYAVQMVIENALSWYYQHDIAYFYVNDELVDTKFVPTNASTLSTEIMEISPETNLFWDDTNLTSKFTIKTGEVE